MFEFGARQINDHDAEPTVTDDLRQNHHPDSPPPEGNKPEGEIFYDTKTPHPAYVEDTVKDQQQVLFRSHHSIRSKDRLNETLDESTDPMDDQLSVGSIRDKRDYQQMLLRFKQCMNKMNSDSSKDDTVDVSEKSVKKDKDEKPSYGEIEIVEDHFLSGDSADKDVDKKVMLDDLKDVASHQDKTDVRTDKLDTQSVETEDVPRVSNSQTQACDLKLKPDNVFDHERGNSVADQMQELLSSVTSTSPLSFLKAPFAPTDEKDHADNQQLPKEKTDIKDMNNLDKSDAQLDRSVGARGLENNISNMTGGHFDMGDGNVEKNLTDSYSRKSTDTDSSNELTGAENSSYLRMEKHNVDTPHFITGETIDTSSGAQDRPTWPYQGEKYGNPQRCTICAC